MATRYQVVLKDLAGARVAIITDWRSLTYTRRVNGVGAYILTIDGNSDLIDLFALDGQVEIYRRDQSAAPSFDWTLDFEGFHRTEIRSTDERGLSRYSSQGVDYTDLIARRAVLFRKGTAGADKVAVGETAIKEYVDQNAGPSALVASGRLFDGITVGLSIQADGAAGLAWTGSRPFRPLLDTIRDISKAATVDFDVVGTGAATFQFQAQARPIGVDRTNNGIDPLTGLNAAGNAPVLFSLAFGNMKGPRYALNRIAEGTAIIVLGQGAQGSRTVVERASADITDSTWNRLEVVKNANQEDTEAGLNAVGDALLDKLQAAETFEWNALETVSLRYGRDYFVGDLVTAEYQGIERDKQVVAAEITIAEGKETISLELADVA